MLEQLNQYAPLISAVAAFVSMGAAVAVAIFSVGTWKLYKLEKGKAEAEEQELDMAMAHFSLLALLSCSELQAFLFTSPEKRSSERYEGVISGCRQSAQVLGQDLPYLLERARSVSPERAKELTYARTLVRRLQQTLPDPENGYSPELDHRLLDALDDLHRLSQAFRTLASVPSGFGVSVEEILRGAVGSNRIQRVASMAVEKLREGALEMGELPEPLSVQAGLREEPYAAPYYQQHDLEQQEWEELEEE